MPNLSTLLICSKKFMPIYHIAYHGCKSKPSEKEMQERMAMFQAAFAAAPYAKEGFLGHYFGPEDGFHDAVCIKFKDLEAYRAHMRAPHGPDEANHLRQTVARIRASRLHRVGRGFESLSAHQPSKNHLAIGGLLTGSHGRSYNLKTFSRLPRPACCGAALQHSLPS